ncbi:MAG: hypothetical protein K0S28_96 [Paucimonas sp.]|nr:hypothetical protein [Paucimonas sp.]
MDTEFLRKTRDNDTYQVAILAAGSAKWLFRLHILSREHEVFVHQKRGADVDDACEYLARALVHTEFIDKHQQRQVVQCVSECEDRDELNSFPSFGLGASESEIPVQNVGQDKAYRIARCVAGFWRHLREIHASEDDAISQQRIQYAYRDVTKKLVQRGRHACTQYCPPSGSHPRCLSRPLNAGRLGGTNRQ